MVPEQKNDKFQITTRCLEISRHEPKFDLGRDQYGQEQSMPLIGNLKTMPLQDLLQWLGQSGQTGDLHLEYDRLMKSIYLDSGQVIGCDSNEPQAMTGHFLLSRGRITEPQLAVGLQAQDQEGGHLGAHLIRLGFITEAVLNQDLAAKSEETIFSLFDWQDAVFHFETKAEPSTPYVKVQLSIEDILLRGLQRWDEAKLIQQTFPHSGFILGLTDKPLPEALRQNKVAEKILALIDGQRTIAQIILESHGSEYQVKKFLFELEKHSLVSIVDENTSHRNTPNPLAIGAELLAGTALSSRLRESHPAIPEYDASGDVLEQLELEISEARQLLNLGEDDIALRKLEELHAAHPHNEPLKKLTAEAEASFIEQAYRHWLPPGQSPKLLLSLEELSKENLSPSEFFLLSRIDGFADIRSIIQVIPEREVDALRTLKRMREQGWIAL